MCIRDRYHGSLVGPPPSDTCFFHQGDRCGDSVPSLWLTSHPAVAMSRVVSAPDRVGVETVSSHLYDGISHFHSQIGPM
eukprot:2336825-Prymnesium_polylepis.1